MSVKANSFQERSVLTLNAALAVIVGFSLAVSRLPCCCYDATLAQSIPSHGAVPQASRFLLGLYAAQMTLWVMIWHMADLSILTLEPRNPTFSMT